MNQHLDTVVSFKQKRTPYLLGIQSFKFTLTLLVPKDADNKPSIANAQPASTSVAKWRLSAILDNPIRHATTIAKIQTAVAFFVVVVILENK